MAEAATTNTTTQTDRRAFLAIEAPIRSLGGGIAALFRMAEGEGEIDPAAVHAVAEALETQQKRLSGLYERAFDQRRAAGLAGSIKAGGDHAEAAHLRHLRTIMRATADQVLATLDEEESADA